jgi:hypothetical protein
MLSVYFKDGRVFAYPVASEAQAREHMGKIWAGGYRHVEAGALTWFGPHYIDKIKYQGQDVSTGYPDSVRGT